MSRTVAVPGETPAALYLLTTFLPGICICHLCSVLAIKEILIPCHWCRCSTFMMHLCLFHPCVENYQRFSGSPIISSFPVLSLLQNIIHFHKFSVEILVVWHLWIPYPLTINLSGIWISFWKCIHCVHDTGFWLKSISQFPFLEMEIILDVKLFIYFLTQLLMSF